MSIRNTIFCLISLMSCFPAQAMLRGVALQKIVQLRPNIAKNIGFPTRKSSEFKFNFSEKDAQLLKKYKIPNELEDQLNDGIIYNEKFRTEIEKPGYFVCTGRNDLACYIKGFNGWGKSLSYENLRKNIYRLENLEKFEKVKNNLAPDDIILPTKFLWHIRNRGSKLNDFNYFVVSEELKPVEKSQYFRWLTDIDPVQLNKICWFIRESGFNDAHNGNIFFTYDCSGKKYWKENYQLLKILKKE